MADRNHVPDEATKRNSYGVAYTEVYCAQCGDTWPCAIRRELCRLEARERENEQ